ncbi:hypothetical protein B4153_6069 [Bacillus cereus]|nr:hypothetical protein B4153_6069 [Bacillus cereus]
MTENLLIQGLNELFHKNAILLEKENENGRKISLRKYVW